MNMFRGLQCEIGQDYFISRPIPESKLYSILTEKPLGGVWDKLGQLHAKL
jgi:hypothetical protein